MAGRKEYEMLFALNARMNGGFSGTFSKAQAEFSRLGREIQDLHKLQGNIASYQKQQAAIEATRSKLENLQKQHDLLQREIGETDGSTAGLERESVKLEQRIKDTEAALERQGQKLEATGAKLREAGVDTSNLAQKDVELTAKIKELQAEQEKAADSAERFGDQTAKALDAIASSEIMSEVIDGLEKIKDAFVECVAVAGSFEETMSSVEALSGAAAGELEQQLRQSGSFAQMMARSELDSGAKRPLLPLSISQIGLIGGSGMINGLIACDTPHIIKGRIVKVVRMESEEKFNYKGEHMGAEVTETISNKMIFNILTPKGFRALT